MSVRNRSLFCVLALAGQAGFVCAQDHSAHSDHVPSASGAGPSLPPITPEARAAAFPDLEGHEAHDRAIRSFFLLDELEWQDANGASALAWDARGWIGGDLQRLGIRAEGNRENSRTTASEIHALWSRKVTPWWDVVAGLRQNFAPGPSQTWAAFGIQGLAPYRLEVEATAYLGEGGQIAARFKAEYELLITNRWVLQPLVELNLSAQDDAAREVSAGLSTIEAGMRLRYEVRRELAPYLGATWHHRLEGSADDARFVAGVRVWF